MPKGSPRGRPKAAPKLKDILDGTKENKNGEEVEDKEEQVNEDEVEDKEEQVNEDEIDDSNDQLVDSEKKDKLQESKPDIIIDTHDNVIKYISKFFKPDSLSLIAVADKRALKNLLKNQLDSFKFIDIKEAEVLKVVLQVDTIEELLKFKDQNLYEHMAVVQMKKFEDKIDFPTLDKKLKKAITIASILEGLRDKSVVITRQQQKIVVAGLDNAGKTAILSKLGGHLGIKDLAMLTPTRRVERKVIAKSNLDLLVLDMGGQEQYRNRYLEKPELYFLSTNLLLYVIDVQDYQRFDETFSYLKRIVDTLFILEESPQILIFLHKYDPDLRENPEVQLQIEFVKEHLQEMLGEKKFDYEIYLTSIYSVITKEPQFAKFLKEMVNDRDLISDPTKDKIESLGGIIDHALNAIMRLSESVSKQFNDIDVRFREMEAKIQTFPEKITPEKTTVSAKPTTAAKLPPIIVKPPPPPPAPSEYSPIAAKPATGATLRGTIISELKELFSKAKEVQRY